MHETVGYDGGIVTDGPSAGILWREGGRGEGGREGGRERIERGGREGRREREKYREWRWRSD